MDESEDSIRQTEELLHGSTSLSTQALNSWTNPRKRPRSYDPTAQLETTIEEQILRQADKTSGLQSPKRMRVDEWPLKSSNDAAESDNSIRPPHRRSPSPRQNRNSNSSIRPSRFLEGSMNDKVSQRPPSLYTREEEAMEQYTSGKMEDVDITCDAGIESNKPSGMFRFGKAIANAFNTATVWQGLNGIWKEREKENQAKPEKVILKAKAELKYAELKKSGYKGTQNAPTRPESQEIPAIEHKDTDDSRRSSFRDSGVDVDGYRSSSDRKNSDHFIMSTESLMPPPPPVTAGRRSASPFSDASSRHRSSLRFHKPSLEGLKKVKSQIHLPSIKRPAEDSASVPPTETNDVTGPGLRREASKKDIAKQYKLSKKVSDLENKLEAARRELELSIQEAPPVPELPAHIGRKRFVPGALASLPSERILTPLSQAIEPMVNGSNAQAATGVEVHKTTTGTDGDKGDKHREHSTAAEDASAEAAKQVLWNRRASDIAARNAAARHSKSSKVDAQIDDVLESEAPKRYISKGKGGGRRKSQEIKVSGSHDSSGLHKRAPKLILKTYVSSPMTIKDEVPPIPMKRRVFDPSKVDQAKILAMRAIPDSHAPFGKAWDDLKNFRKLYPDATEVELKAYMDSPPASKKVTDHTSVAHGDRPSSPFLGRPGSTSPMKTRARASRRGISPPPPSLSSAKKFHRDLDPEKSPTPTNQNPPQTDKEVESFATKAPLTSEKIPEATRASLDKPLPDIKADEFEWDDDVF